MANKTIYPYGTNGQLPSSIGVIDDLTTGGADKALSAEQGKVLNEKTNNLNQKIRCGHLTTDDCDVVADSYYDTSQHKVATSSYNNVIVVDVTGAVSVKFLGLGYSSAAYAGYGFYNAGGALLADTAYRIETVTGNVPQESEYTANVPQSAAVLKLTLRKEAMDDWYCIVNYGIPRSATPTSLDDLCVASGDIEKAYGSIRGKNDAMLARRHAAASSYESASGNRYSLIFPVTKGTKINGLCAWQKGLSIAVYTDVWYALRGISNGVVQTIQNAYTTNRISGVVTANGYLRIATARTDNASISNQDIEDFMDALSLEIVNEGQMLNALAGKVEQNDKQILDGTRYVFSLYNRIKPNFNLLHFSDIHGDTIALQQIVDFMSDNSDSLDDAIHTGDNVWYKWSHGMDFWDGVNGSETILNCIGNHDTSNSGGYSSGDRTAAECRGRYITPYLSSWGSVQINNDVCYYYKDYANYDIRLIVLDIYHWDSTQSDWLASTLTSSLSSNKHVILAAHSPEALFGNKTNTPFDAIELPEAYSMSASLPCIDASAISAVADFIDDGGHFVCYLCGHMHLDVMRWFKNHTNMLSVSVQNASVLAHISGATTSTGPNNSSLRVVGETSERCFNVVSVDTNNKIVTIFRIGQNYDAYGRHIGAVVYDYDNNVILSQR